MGAKIGGGTVADCDFLQNILSLKNFDKIF